MFCDSDGHQALSQTYLSSKFNEEIEAGGNHKSKLNSNMTNMHKAYQSVPSSYICGADRRERD